jgi:hypothetical protein
MIFWIIMGKIKCSLCFKQKRAKMLIFVPEIALRVDGSDPAQNCFKGSRPLRSCGNIKPLLGEAGGSAN